MTNTFLNGALTAAFAVSAFCILAANASAGDVATRCDNYGCAHIVCHEHGDRCYREDDYGREYSDDDRYREDGRYGHYRDAYTSDEDMHRNYERDKGWRYDCDRDADRCSVRREYSGDRGW